MKPAAMLITSLQVEVGLTAQARVRLYDSGMTYPRIKPDILSIFFLREVFISAALTRKVGWEKLSS